MSDTSENNQSAKNNEPERVALTSGDVAAAKRAELIAALKAVMPGAVAEGRVDLKQIAAELGEDVTVTEKERFGLNWPGRAECMRIIQRPSTGTLKPDVDESVDFDTTENLFIEGDNLEVLKLLQTAYHNRVKMIYIDPPYNTGNEFIYPDKFSETLKTYLDYTGQLDADGNPFRSKTEQEKFIDRSGSFHSNWLNMMYPRLYLARTLLKDDGVIFISIDDNEAAHLRELCDFVFGEENFVAQLVWEKRFTRNNDARLMSSVIDYVFMYRKSDLVSKLREPRTEKANSIYSNPDDDPRGPWTSVSYVSQRTKEQRPNLSYAITNPNTGETCSHEVNAWKYSKEQNDIHAEENRLYWGKEGNNQYPRLKRFLAELDDGIVPINLWSHKDTGTIDDGTKMVNGLIGKDIFDYPKPISLLQRMLKMVTSTANDDIILDFFSGSGTTAHAVMDLNAEDGGSRKYICVQLPEPCDEKSEALKAGYKTIADIGKERIRRAGAKIKETIAAKTQGALPGFEDGGANADLDIGFKVFKLDKSTMLPWNMPADEFDESGAQLDQHVLHLDGQAREQDILYELLLKSGFPLETKIEVVEMAGKEVHSVEDGALLICLDKELTTEVIDAMAAADPLEVICLDEGFQNNDQLKTNAVQAFKSRARSKETQIVFKTV